MKILVTGSRGFVGSFISKHLSEKHTILTPARNELDLTDLEQVKQWFNHNEVDVVVALRPVTETVPALLAATAPNWS